MQGQEAPLKASGASCVFGGEFTLVECREREG